MASEADAIYVSFHRTSDISLIVLVVLNGNRTGIESLAICPSFTNLHHQYFHAMKNLVMRTVKGDLEKIKTLQKNNSTPKGGTKGTTKFIPLL